MSEIESPGHGVVDCRRYSLMVDGEFSAMARSEMLEVKKERPVSHSYPGAFPTLRLPDRVEAVRRSNVRSSYAAFLGCGGRGET
jgi:hypothetical protein